MVQLFVKEKGDNTNNSLQTNVIYVSQAQKDIIHAIISVLSESLFISEHLTKILLYRSIKLILCGYEDQNCYRFEQHFNSEERRMLYNKIRDQFLLLLGNMMTITPEHEQILMGLNNYFIPLIDEYYSTEKLPENRIQQF